MLSRPSLGGRDILVGGGEMGARMRALDWAATPAGPPETWSQALRTTVRLVLTNRHPMFIFWGETHVCFYNDAYRLTMGPERHPGALGQPGRQVWDEIWPIIGPQIAQVMAGGDATWHQDQLVPVTRHGRIEEVWWTYGFSPIDDPTAAGGVGGVLVVCNDVTREHGVHEALRVAEERTRLALAAAGSVGTWDWDIAADRIFASAPFARLYGVDPVRAAAGVPLSEFTGNMHADDLERVQQAIQHAIENDEEFAAEYRLLQPDGTVRWVAARGRPIRGSDGAPSRFPGVAIDITERVQAEADLRATQRRQEFLLALADKLRGQDDPRAGMQAAVDAIGRYLCVSRVGYGLVSADQTTVALETEYVDGVAPLAGSYPLLAFGPGNIANLQAGRTSVYRDVEADPGTAGVGLGAFDIAAIVAVPLVREGQLRSVLYLNHHQPRAWSAAEIHLVEGVATRIWGEVERVRSQDMLQELNATLEAQVAERTAQLSTALAALEISTDRLRTAFQTSFVFQGFVDPDGTVVDANPTALAAIESRLEDVMGMPLWQTPWFSATPGVADIVRAMVLRAAAGEAGLTSMVIDLPTGRRSFDFSIRPIKNDAGTVVGLVPEAVETTGRRAAEEQLRQSQKMEAVGQLTGGLAHDFNNLLTAIVGSLELLQARVAQGRIQDMERYINAAQDAGRRASALTHRLLAFSRQQTLDPKPTDLNQLVAGMEELVRRTIGPGITLKAVAADGLWNTLVDPSQLENALLNLCINARDAMPDGGRLTIATGNKAFDVWAARERELQPGQYVTLCVTDSGTGMTPEVIARAFDPFFTTKPIGMGTGLGLSMIYGFVRQSGGQVRIDSERGHGATVCLYLPRHFGATENADSPADHAATPRAGPGETVLVVDDEPTVRMLITEVLRDLGYDPLEAADAAAGLEILRLRARVDLLVTDVGLPGGMNGRQMAEAARVSRPNLKVLFITGYAETAALSHGHLQPGMHVMTKPFAIDALASRIKALITG